MQKINLTKIFLVFEIFLVFFFTMLNWGVNATGGHWAPQNLFSNDNATLLVTAISHHKGLGVPYKDYWEYRPPLFFMILDFWTKAFGVNLVSLKILESFFRFLIGLALVFIVRRIFPPFQGLVLCLLTFFTFYSPVFNSWLYSEAFGLFFALAGVLTLFYLHRTFWRFPLAFGFFIAAMETKDTFGGVALAILPSLFSFLVLKSFRSLLKAVCLCVLGVIVLFFLEGLYLKYLNALVAYFEVYDYLVNFSQKGLNIYFVLSFLKRYYLFFFGVKEYLSFFQPPIYLLLLAWALLIILSFGKRRGFSLFTGSFLNFFSNVKTIDTLTILFFSLGAYLGSALVFRITPHYVLFVLIPTFFIWALFANSFANLINNKIRSLNKVMIFTLLVLLLLLPTNWISNQYPIIPTNFLKQAYLNFTLNEGDTSMEKYVKSKTTQEDCVLSVYGWKSSELYLYSERKPCTRFFIPNMVDKEWQKAEYRDSILKKPPRAIIYSVNGADMDVEKFEREVFNFSSVLKNCYKRDLTYTTNGRWPSFIYFPLFTGDKLKVCLKETLGTLPLQILKSRLTGFVS